jgi:c-di-GMP-binding flagellar brake protein YcgR
MSQISGLTVRQHERAEIELSVEFVVRQRHREQVRFSPISNAAEPYVTRGKAIDLSSGGMGLICRQFVPRMCDGTVRVFDPIPVGKASDGTPIHEVIFEHAVKVRRVSMASHEPTYALGIAFVDPEPDIEARVERLMKRIVQANAAAAGEGGADA